jgi:hypothetical protein
MQRADQARIPHQSSRIEQEWLIDHFRNEMDDEPEPGFDSAAVSEWLAKTIGRSGQSTPYVATASRLCHFLTNGHF